MGLPSMAAADPFKLNAQLREIRCKEPESDVEYRSVNHRPMTNSSGQVTRLLAEMRLGREGAFAELFPLVYPELRRLAGGYLRKERAGHTLQPTALVHEAFLRLIGQDRAAWQSRSQFMGVSAQIMRRILVDHARRRAASKRGGVPGATGGQPLELSRKTIQFEDILAVNEALGRLARFDSRQARIVEMRYFGGMSFDETAEVLGVSSRTVKSDWAVARAWLHAELAERTL